MLSRPKYEAREMGPASLGDRRPIFGVFDTFTQTFVIGSYDSLSAAVRAADRHNAHYEMAMRDED